MKTERILAIVAAVMLLLAIPSIWPYGYFMILRWVVAGSAAYIAYLAYEENKTAWIWTMAVIAILFNPIFPVHLTKEIWVFVDLIVAVIFLASMRINLNR